MIKITLTLIAFLVSIASFSQTKISADSAGSYMGKEVMVCSKVFEVRTFDKLTLLRLGAAYPNSPLTIAINKDSAAFEIPFENYNQKNICVIGTIKMYKGKPEIVVTKQDQMTFAAPEGVIKGNR